MKTVFGVHYWDAHSDWTSLHLCEWICNEQRCVWDDSIGLLLHHGHFQMKENGWRGDQAPSLVLLLLCVHVQTDSWKWHVLHNTCMCLKNADGLVELGLHYWSFTCYSVEKQGIFGTCCPVCENSLLCIGCLWTLTSCCMTDVPDVELLLHD